MCTASLNASASPTINRLPIELLQEIFLQCLPSDRFILPALTKAPILLTRVCSTWWRTALSSPRLWRSFALHLSPHRGGTVTTHQLSLMRSWLPRARAMSTALFVYAPHMPGDTLEEIFDALTECGRTQQISDLRVTLPERYSAPLIALLNAGGASRLKSLELRLGEPLAPLGQPLERLEVGDVTMPELESLTIASSVPHFSSVGSLRVFVIESPIPAMACVEMLGQCPALEECSVAKLRVDHDAVMVPGFTKGATEMKYLRTLALSTNDTQSIGIILASLVLPTLDTLRFTDTAYEDAPAGGATWLAALENTLRAAPVKELHLHNVIPSPEALLRVLAAAPALTHLALSDLRGGAPVDGSVLAALTVLPNSDHRHVLCPKLEVVKLGTCLDVEREDGVLGRMVASRWCSNGDNSKEGVSRLRSINPRLDGAGCLGMRERERPGAFEEDRRVLWALREEGLEGL